MRYSIVKTEDVEAVKEFYSLTLPKNSWQHDDHEHWMVQDEAGNVAGFCSAVYWPELDCVYLSAAGVVFDARGAGLQRRMVDVRTQWAKRQGAKWVATYVATDNYASMFNLMRKGFRGQGAISRDWNVFVKGIGGNQQWNTDWLRAVKRKLFG